MLFCIFKEIYSSKSSIFIIHTRGFIMYQKCSQTHASQEENSTIYDLWQEITEPDSEMLKGGLLPAVQAAREAARTTSSQATGHTISICRDGLCGGPPA
jgi:hypothetical protein